MIVKVDMVLKIDPESSELLDKEEISTIKIVEDYLISTISSNLDYDKVGKIIEFEANLVEF